MKKLILILGLFLFTGSFCTGPNYEVFLEEESESDDQATEFPPIELKISLSNTQIAHSNNKTEVSQKQAESYKKQTEAAQKLAIADRELLEKKLKDQQDNINYVKTIALLALVVAADPYQSSSIVSSLWKIIW
jgi:hypothetical protein